MSILRGCKQYSSMPIEVVSVLLLVAFSCALRRDKLDGSESWPSSSNAPNLCEIWARGPVSLFVTARDSLLLQLQLQLQLKLKLKLKLKQPGLVASSTTIFDRLGIDHLCLTSKRSRWKHADVYHSEWLLPNCYLGEHPCPWPKKVAWFDECLFLGYR